ncbi:hypothetical protein CBQ26_01220 [Deinococcus indicus]|uniref:Uncharacterized protein n=1 Tax=Deinococcus indicus TaxID=223556 RepID=A0A246BUA5_9DEIO|nr:hypothetical protein CBQ26_01220 [Deinococcus indicus]
MNSMGPKISVRRCSVWWPKANSPPRRPTDCSRTTPPPLPTSTTPPPTPPPAPRSPAPRRPDLRRPPDTSAPAPARTPPVT